LNPCVIYGCAQSTNARGGQRRFAETKHIHY
jgi:hypothetical protein